MALDIGLKRIGVAIYLENSLVTPIEAVLRRNRKQASREVSNLLKKWNIEKLVVGIPLNSSKTEEMRRRFTHFISLLEFQGEIFFQDESFSSLEAEELLQENHSLKRDGRVDSLSAKIILERFLKN